jgi:hypothetical protein
MATVTINLKIARTWMSSADQATLISDRMNDIPDKIADKIQLQLLSVGPAAAFPAYFLLPVVYDQGTMFPTLFPTPLSRSQAVTGLLLARAQKVLQQDSIEESAVIVPP